MARLEKELLGGWELFLTRRVPKALGNNPTGSPEPDLWGTFQFEESDLFIFVRFRLEQVWQIKKSPVPLPHSQSEDWLQAKRELDFQGFF